MQPKGNRLPLGIINYEFVLVQLIDGAEPHVDRGLHRLAYIRVVRLSHLSYKLIDFKLIIISRFNPK